MKPGGRHNGFFTADREDPTVRTHKRSHVKRGRTWKNELNEVVVVDKVDVSETGAVAVQTIHSGDHLIKSASEGAVDENYRVLSSLIGRDEIECKEGRQLGVRERERGGC